MTTAVKTAPESDAATEEKPAAPAPWPLASIADLLAHPGNVRATEADAELTASIAEHGIEDPLHVVRLSDGTPQVIDGFRRIAAAQAAGLESVPYSPIPQIRVSELTPHKGNLRKGLRLTKEFVASIRADGVTIPVLITTGDGGALLLVDGHRRLAGAIEAGRTHMPYERRERNAAQQRLDMLTTAVHRAPLTEAEVTAGLFDAAELGASTAQIATASGRTQKLVKATVKAAGAAPVKALREAVPAVALTLDQMSDLSELDDETAAMKEIAEAATKGENLTYVIRRVKGRQEADKSAAARLVELQAAGARIREADELSERAQRIYYLRDQAGKSYSEDRHAAECRGAVFVRGTSDYTQWCANPGLYEHKVVHPNEAGPRKTAAETRAIKAGNIDWQAATDTRRAWVKALLAKGRKYTAAETAALQKAVTLAMLSGFGSISGRFGDHRTLPTLAELLGTGGAREADFVKLMDRATAARLVALAFAKIAACGEMDATREAWREDGGGRRTKTREYLGLLVMLGYTPTVIEQAVMADKPYTPKP
ncbi:ParB N-terminal domain-containing protein (plasmid) [Kitasatospora sp. NBC_01246]|uniref:ParB/RepB/Spo0J family partition protein n=1 Tax=Kitasatospora sp. NBC_01246 TaxID=2903570 RepID=UPI002E31B80C|nr:ParB N-terminal domain-containing protein [Kitasatospora sp. NBC_01246]